MKSAWKDWHTKKEGVVEPEAEKLEELFKENNAARILDVGCGAGRHTFYFARKGFEVYGFDEDEDAIKNRQTNPTEGEAQGQPPGLGYDETAALSRRVL